MNYYQKEELINHLAVFFMMLSMILMAVRVYLAHV